MRKMHLASTRISPFGIVGSSSMGIPKSVRGSGMRSLSEGEAVEMGEVEREAGREPASPTWRDGVLLFELIPLIGKAGNAWRNSRRLTAVESRG